MTGTEAIARPPGPVPQQMLREAMRMRRDPLGFLQDVAAEYGELVEFPMPRRRVYFGNSPEVVQQVLQTQHRSHDRATVQYRSLSLVTGNGLLTSDGELWKRHRRLMQPAFHRALMDRYLTHLEIGIDRLVSTWDAQPNGTIVDVDAAMMRTALEVVGRALFSHDLSGDAARLVHAVLEALDVVVARARSPIPLPIDWPSPGNRKLARSLQTLDDTVVAMLRERRRVDRLLDADDQSPADLLGMLLAARDDIAGTGFDDRQLRDEIVTLIVAGHETVASALTWTWHLLAQNPDAEKRLHDELDDVLAGRRPTFADLERLTYTRQVIDEALRLYPPAWVISRRAVVDAELAGHAVPSGSYVFVSPYVLHRTPELWPEPDRFEPDRFAPGVAIDRFAYIPFGAGPNLCIGRDFALLEATLLVADVASRFRLAAIPGAEVHVDPLVTIRPRGGLPMVLSRREG